MKYQSGEAARFPDLNETTRESHYYAKHVGPAERSGALPVHEHTQVPSLTLKTMETQRPFPKLERSKPQGFGKLLT